MDRRYAMRRVGLFFLPIVVSTIFLLVLWGLLPVELRPVIGLLLIGYFISPLGREILIPLTVIAMLELHGSAQMTSDTIWIVTCIMFVDVMCSLFLLWNMDLLKHVPKVGGWIEGMEDFGRRKLRKSRKRRFGMFVALTAYMASPFYGSHGVASTVIGMLAGMRKARVWLAIWLGSLAGSLSIAIIAFTAGQHFLIDIFGNAAWKAISVLVGFSIFTAIIGRYWTHRKGRGGIKA